MFVQRLIVPAGSQVVVSVRTEPGKPFHPSDLTVAVKTPIRTVAGIAAETTTDPKTKERFAQTW